MGIEGLGAHIAGDWQYQDQAGKIPEKSFLIAGESSGDADKKTAIGGVISSSLQVSSAVNAVLLRFQETGSVFDEKDTNLQNIRGVPDEYRQRFARIIQEAVEKGGYNDPVAYIHSLSEEDVEVLRRVHSLAERDGVLDTDNEGAINLLLPRQNHVDLNNDAVVKTGKAAGFYFPPPNAPQSVKDAWEETTKDMPSEDLLMAQAPFLVTMVAANIKYDADGTAVGVYDYMDSQYANPLDVDESGWRHLLEQLIEQAKAFAGEDAYYAKQARILTEFRQNIA